MTQCTARVFVFSGRPDPSWIVDERQSRTLTSIWEQLEPCDPVAPVLPRLGYRGVSLTCAAKGEFTAFAGYVTRRYGSLVEYRKDGERLFERSLLSTAPDNSIPAAIMKDLNGSVRPDSMD